MSTIKVKINSVLEIQNLAYDLTHLVNQGQVLALNGDLGAGKTTFTKGIGKALGVSRVINSPTFTIMKIYDALNKINGIEKLYHLDVYRLNDSSDDFELEEYFYSTGITVIEWADIIKDIIPNDAIYITITRISDDTRMVILDHIDNNIKDFIGEHYEIIN